jgi:hypothetical protein
MRNATPVKARKKKIAIDVRGILGTPIGAESGDGRSERDIEDPFERDCPGAMA